MSDPRPDEGPAPGKKGIGRILVPIVCLLLGAAAGGAGGWFAPQFLPAPEDGAKPKPKAPKVGPLEYVPIDNAFTANLKDSGRFVQVRIAVSTHGGQPVVEAVERHKVAIVSVVLGILSDTGEAELNQPGGREALTARMRMAINDVLQRKSGLAGIDDVFLTSFVMQ